MVLKHVVYRRHKKHVSNNWDKLKCSPLGPILQMIGIAPGNASDTSNSCKSSGFSSQFNSGMSGHVSKSNKMSANMNMQDKIINKIRGVIANIEQRAFNELSKIAKIIFQLYEKVGNIFYVIIKHLVNILNIFRQFINFGGALTKLTFEWINVFVDIMNFFSP
jgi:hypothetical protein